jgi:hypothetical protein
MPAAKWLKNPPRFCTTTVSVLACVEAAAADAGLASELAEDDLAAAALSPEAFVPDVCADAVDEADGAAAVAYVEAGAGPGAYPGEVVLLFFGTAYPRAAVEAYDWVLFGTGVILISVALRSSVA